METRKLYYEDCHLRSFSAQVTGCTETEKGFEILLDATAFYPEGGGQACDLGVLGDAKVLDVREAGEQVVHLCDKPLVVGETVNGQIDWDRRFDLMQQHAGEHIVSGIIHRMFGYHNVGFHVGKGLMEVDFDGPIPAEALAKIEREANEAVWANVPLRCWVPGAEELPQVFYRTKRPLPWPVRIVEIPGYDSCACCGIHVGMTGEIGLIKIISCTKFHGGVRLEMLCGGRAYEYMARIFEENRQVSQAFSAKMPETGAAARKMNEALAAEKFRANALEKKLFAQIAECYVNHGNVLLIRSDLTGTGVRDLAEAIASVCGGTAAVLSGSGDNYNVCLVNKRGEVKELGQAMNKTLNGRGGGKPGFFQGSVKADQAKIEAFFKGIGFCEV